MLALACDLTGSWPAEAMERSQTELMLTARLASRLRNEESKQFRN